MALEKRSGGRCYYYRSVREGDKVRRVYMGAGESARISAEQATLRRTGEKARAEREREERERLESLAAPVFELCEVADVLTRAHLAAGGYRRIKGEWRLRRGQSA